MKIASVADVKAQFSAYVKATEEELVVITKNGKPVAVMLPIEDEDALERMILAHSKQFKGILERSRKELRKSGGIRHEDFWRDIES